MALTEEQLEETTLRVSQEMCLALNDDEAIALVRGVIAALPKPEAVVPDVLFDGYLVLMALSERQRSRTSPENVSDTLDAVVRLLRSEATIAQPASAPTRWDAEFLSKRLGRVAKLAGVSIPERFTHEKVAEAAGTILGRIATAMEAKTASAPSEQKPECPYPCGWENLYSLIVSNGALIVRSVDPDSVSESTWTSLSNTIEHAKELCKHGMSNHDYKAQRDALMGVLNKARNALVQWHVPENRYSAIESIDAAIVSVKGGA